MLSDLWASSFSYILHADVAYRHKFYFQFSCNYGELPTEYFWKY